MNTMKLRMAAGAGLTVVLITASAGAQCLSAAGWKSGAAVKPAVSQAMTAGARLLRTAYQPDEDSWKHQPEIVGMWHVHLISGAVSGVTGAMLPPVGVEIDAGFQQWHSDGTEMLNSGRAAADSNFCMGVWEQVGPRTFQLNHFAISYTQGPPANSNEGPTNILVGPTSITETVVVSPDGKTFTGTFTITDYTEMDPPAVSAPAIVWHDTISGSVMGTRIDLKTPVSPIF